jgi:hypothetical protein
VTHTAERINHAWGTPTWTPIVLHVEDDRARSLAALTISDVLLVNPVRDGLNLVAKEGPLLNARTACSCSPARPVPGKSCPRPRWASTPSTYRGTAEAPPSGAVDGPGGTPGRAERSAIPGAGPHCRGLAAAISSPPRSRSPLTPPP